MVCTNIFIKSGSILTGVLAIFIERELSSWMIGWDCRLLVVAYLGIVSCGPCVVTVFWSSMMKGPLFVSSFTHLGLVFTALAGSLFLKEELCLGSLIGSIIITIGLCLVIWGKGKEATTSQDGETGSRRDEVTDGSEARIYQNDFFFGAHCVVILGLVCYKDAMP
ncbi:WAT1-related protein At1g68170-like isoform X1 [Coffea eugenioides]|uniref:WAT1-related protein At1g68170-like isoform X1 n=1 Tax=Coffea eugenioides TaxID=49369 RepID=UPI000F611504|nr:WAT1-related protein At1g68170-like isoform X1 [Coffea eugenioides]